MANPRLNTTKVSCIYCNYSYDADKDFCPNCDYPNSSELNNDENVGQRINDAFEDLDYE